MSGGNERVELGRRDLDRDGLVQLVEGAAICVATDGVRDRPVGVPDGGPVGELADRRVRRGPHEKLIDKMSSGSSVGVTTKSALATSSRKSTTCGAFGSKGGTGGAGGGLGKLPPRMLGPEIWRVTFVCPSKSL